MEADGKPYDRLLSAARRRTSRVKGRTLEEEADSDRGRVLFSAPFRRLQNKAQVFSLESNAAIRSRLTHSLEVSSIGRFVAQQAIKAFSMSELDALGLAGKERPLITFVETACLLHDLGNPPFGHFGELAISDWFHLNSNSISKRGLGGAPLKIWNKYYTDFRHFDGNPQGFRIATKLQPIEAGDQCGLNLTVTTLAATLKYPWTSESVGDKTPDGKETRKKAGYFHTEQQIVDWICENLRLDEPRRYPLVYLMEAADDIAYCLSDIEDGIEKGLITGKQFSDYMRERLEPLPLFKNASKDAKDILQALNIFDASPDKLMPMAEFRSAVIRLLASHAGIMFKKCQNAILDGTSGALLRDCEGTPLLNALKDFSSSSLYSSRTVRNREITAQAILSGLLDAYLPLMRCDRDRFDKALLGQRQDSNGHPIAWDGSLIGRISRKYLAVYKEAVRQAENEFGLQTSRTNLMERIYRIRLIVDYLSGMTDEFALQTFQLISGAQVSPYRD